MGEVTEAPSIASLVRELIPVAWEAANVETTSLVTSQRDLYYVLRRMYLAHPRRPVSREGMDRSGKNKKEGGVDEPLSYKYFTGRMLPDYENRHGELAGLIREPRWHFSEPHGWQTL